MRLLIHEKSLGRIAADLAGACPGVEPVVVNDAGEISLAGATLSPETAQVDAAWANADVFFSGGARAFMTAALKSPSLKWVQSGAAGFDNPVFGQFVQKGARLTTSHGQSVGMADYVLWGVLDAFQDGAGRRAAQAARQWERRPFREIEGSRWLILGFGAIGRGVAQRAKAFGAHVTAVRRSTAPDVLADAMAPPAAFLDLLPQADVVVLAAPATPETRHIANAEAFGRMKAGSVLVNVGRGALVDEPALLAALDAGVPAHAVLDVFETEPLPSDSPFWTHPRVTLTPHSSGITAGNVPRNDALFLENLRRYLAGEPLQNQADPKDVLAGG
ncbi:D-2-hydroxyacid dehydrogenase [Phenylobacterium kunshanense]|uniref:D-2-hydroxyacid dehydrogenase n=1 Tax=Phenylobacterium kunshanense TaxID=1445034 RepID=A0A328BL72_9CAUL|nr:D-2-hydroxyacid dehydrogenase [Phenylobacterium kunshanense]RAK67379.1 D-2-hydroxyacid dehydrogenase [Phenylobacterium kunshanense]